MQKSLVKSMVVGVLVSTSVHVFAQGDGMGRGNGPFSEAQRAERQAFREEQREAARAHREEMREEHRAFVESLSDLESPAAMLDAAIAYCTSKQDEATSFQESQRDKRMSSLGESLAKNENMTDEKREEILAKALSASEARLAEAAERQQERLARLQSLQGKADLTRADVMSALRPEGGRSGERQGGKEKNRHPKGRFGGDDGMGEPAI